MIIDFESLGAEPKDFALEVPAEKLELEGERIRLSERVRVKGDARREGDAVIVQGRIASDAEIGCTRCLEPVSRPFDIEFVSRYVRPDAFGTAGESELIGADLEYDSVPAGEIDLVDIVREQLMLDIPAQALCREDCRGLCERCGGNRNTEICECDAGDTDPRWSALKNLQ